MAEQIQRLDAEQLLMREMGINSEDLERRKSVVGLSTADLQHIVALREVVQPHIESLTSAFFAYLAKLPGAKGLVSNRDLLERARRLKVEHLSSMLNGNVDADYVAQRIGLGFLYSKSGVDSCTFLGAFHDLLKSMGGIVMKGAAGTPERAFESFMSLEKLAFFDLGVIIDALVAENARVIRQQADAIRELSTPVLQIRERLLLLPIIGVIDTHRAQLITENLLRAVRANRAKAVVVDVTGVAAIDSRVANHLLQTVTAARLMGAVAIVTGLSAEVAQSLVALGIDLTRINTVGDLQGGLEDAERLLGYRVVRSHEASAPAPTRGEPAGADTHS
jgi:rsbT co-antagonist protein RsbR